MDYNPRVSILIPMSILSFVQEWNVPMVNPNLDLNHNWAQSWHHKRHGDKTSYLLARF